MKDWISPLGMKFSLIVPGAFVMGSDNGEENERPPHQVAIGRPFYMGTYVVTQRDWRELMGTKPWEGAPHVRDGDAYPAVNVSWRDVRGYLDRINDQDKGNSYYLPTEEEWEYAARAGTNTEFSFGDDQRDMRNYGWYRDNTQGSEEYAHEVGKKNPNPWGLYDIHGNIWEWMDDWYWGSYSAQPKLEPPEKVLRGVAGTIQRTERVPRSEITCFSRDQTMSSVSALYVDLSPDDRRHPALRGCISYRG